MWQDKEQAHQQAYQQAHQQAHQPSHNDHCAVDTEPSWEAAQTLFAAQAKALSLELSQSRSRWLQQGRDIKQQMRDVGYLVGELDTADDDDDDDDEDGHQAVQYEEDEEANFNSDFASPDPSSCSAETCDKAPSECFSSSEATHEEEEENNTTNSHDTADPPAPDTVSAGQEETVLSDDLRSEESFPGGEAEAVSRRLNEDNWDSSGGWHRQEDEEGGRGFEGLCRGPNWLPNLEVGDSVYGMTDQEASDEEMWKPGRVTKMMLAGGESSTRYTVTFDDKRSKVLKGTEIAYGNTLPCLCPIGCRVIAIFTNEEIDNGYFYSGTVAEVTKGMYLVILDDGYPLYVDHKNIRRMVKNGENTLYSDVQEWTRKYLSSYPSRSLLRLNVGETVRADFEGSWQLGEVVDTKKSLVRLKFSTGVHFWFSKDSAQLEPIKDLASGRHDDEERSRRYQETMAAMDKMGKVVRVGVALSRSRDLTDHECSSLCLLAAEEKDLAGVQQGSPYLLPLVSGWERQVAQMSEGSKNRRAVFYTAPCGRRLRSVVEVFRYLKVTNSSLEIDCFNFDWWLNAKNKFVAFKDYLQMKDISFGKESLPVPAINSISSEYPPFLEYSTVRLPQKDVRINTEPAFLVSCSCADSCEDKLRCSCAQLTIRAAGVYAVGYQYRRLTDVVTTGVYECNPGCSCSSSCLNRVVQRPVRHHLQVFRTKKCGWGLRSVNDIPAGSFICLYVGKLYNHEESTMQGTKFGDEYHAVLDLIEVAENFKEGYESDVTNIEEEEAAANELANVNEANKEEEADVSSSGSSETTARSNAEMEQQPTTNGGDSDIYQRYESVGSPYNVDRRLNDVDDLLDTTEELIEEEEMLEQMDGAVEEPAENGSDSDGVSPAATTEAAAANRKRSGSPPPSELPGAAKHARRASGGGLAPPRPRPSARKLMDPEEDTFVMDARTTGNIGRYLNHSCDPNTFIQNVFVDTHDLRFPWLAFFSCKFIHAGDELSWDYAYEVGSVPNKSLQCHCGANKCRGRLL